MTFFWILPISVNPLMDAKLNQIIELSNRNQNVIAITHCHNYDKLDYLKRFINRLKAAGFTLIPLPI